ncbi:MAG: AAA family ATPase [Alphaproteobacteria bacterium]|nr:AAA family ATPase [Alphaproteobacteria bacterium]
MLKRIYIDNYRCFSNFEFRPERINLLLGANGSGKTCLFEVLHAVTDVAIRGGQVSEVFPASSLTRWDKRDSQRVELELVGDQGTYQYLLILLHSLEPGRERTVISTEEIKLDGRTLFLFEGGTVHLFNNEGEEKVKFPFRGDSSFLARLEDRPESAALRGGLNLLSAIQLLKLNTSAMHNVSASEEEVLASDGSNFPSWYRHIQQESALSAMSIFEHLQRALPGFRELKLVSSGGVGRARDLAASFSSGGSRYDVHLDELSDGQRALIVLYSLLQTMHVSGATLLLDEPTAHVSLTEIQPWLQELDEHFIDDGQVFVISHHPEIVDYLSAAAPFWFDRPSGGPARVRPANFERESGLSASQQIARGFVDEP